MIVFLWDSYGPGRFHGVTDDKERALQRAEDCITSGAASGARVEVAQLVTSFAALTTQYRRTGDGWTAQRPHRDDVVIWMRL